MIRLTKDVRIAGVETPADGSWLELAADLEASLVSANQAVYVSDRAMFPPSSGGYRTVLFGDSMTDTYEQIQAPLTTPYSYERATGLLTVTFSSGHQQAKGWWTYYWDRNFPALSRVRLYRIAERVDASTLKLDVGANLPGVPDGDLTPGNNSMRPRNLRNAEAFVPWLNAISGNRFNVVWNGAQSGDKVSQCIDRLYEACLRHEPDVVIMQMPGVNDSGVVNEETIHANRVALIDAIVQRVPRLILLNTTPVAAGEVRATKPIMQRIVRMNRRLRTHVAGRPNVLLFDAYRRIVNPTDTTGLAQSNVLRTSDNIHYCMRGGKLIADQLWTQIGGIFPTDNSTLPCSVQDCFAAAAVSLTSVTRTSNDVITATATGHGLITGERAKVFAAAGASEALNEWVTVTVVDSNTVKFASAGADGSITGTISLSTNNNLMPNPLLTGTGAAVGGGITGNFASSTNAFLTEVGGTAMTVSTSLVSRSDGYGQDQVTQVTFGDANDRFAMVTNITDLARHIKAGRTYEVEAEVSITGVSGSNLSELRFNLAAVMDGVTYQTYALAGYTNGATLNSDTGVLHLKTPPLTIPAFTSMTQAPRMDLTLRGSAAGTALTVKVGRIALREYEGS